MQKFLLRLYNLFLNLSSLLILFSVFFILKLFKKQEKRRIKKIAWFGAYGNSNLGDDLIFYSLKRLLKHTNFNYQLSVRDKNKIKNYGVKTFIKGEQFYDFIKYVNVIRKSDAVFLGGGGLFEYYYSSNPAYRMILIYLCPLIIARIYNKPTFVLGVGVNEEKLDNQLIRFIFKHTLSETNLFITRDEKSKRGLLNNGVKTKIYSSYDPVLSLKFDRKKPKIKKIKRKIGLILWPYFLWPHFYKNSSDISNAKRQKHIEFLAKINIIISDLNKNYDLEFLTFHFSDTLLYNQLDLDSPIKPNLKTYMSQLNSIDLLITMRYHGQITAVLNNVPVIAISVQQKMDAFMENFETEKFNFDVNNFTPNSILKSINEVFNDEEQIKLDLNRKAIHYRKKIKSSYFSLFCSDIEENGLQNALPKE